MKSIFHHSIIILFLINNILIGGQGSAGAKFLQINTTTRGAANAGTMVARPGLIDALSYNPATTATLTGSNFDAFKAGNIETTIVMNIEHTDIIRIEFKLISDGILLKK